MNLRRNMNPRPGAARAISASERPSWLLHAGILVAAMVACLALVGPARGAEAAGAPELRRFDILLAPGALLDGDRARAAERLAIIADARASDLPLFQSFDPREVLAETLATLEALGADLGPTAIVNFDSIEVSMPAHAADTVAALPFVTNVRAPIAPTPAGLYDSEGVPLIRADLAQAAGALGATIRVAIIDRNFEALQNTMDDPSDELYTIPTSDMFEQQTSGNTNFNNKSLEAFGNREHGAAAAEVIYETAPSAVIKLYGVKSTAGIEAAITHAATLGFEVIHVPLTHMETMTNPTNRFTDDIDFAVASGSVVVVAAGNEALRHIEDTYRPCAECDSADPGYLCEDENEHDSDYHKFMDPFDERPLNAILIAEEYWFEEQAVDLVCWSAIEAGFDPDDFKFRLFVYNDGTEHDEPTCPGDSGASTVSGTDTNLGDFFQKTIVPFDGEGDENFYYIGVRYTGALGTPPTPKFRISCGTGISEMQFATTTGSLSDLAVVESAITVAEVDAFIPTLVSEESSQGPASAGPLKPDISGPGFVSNFAVDDFGFDDFLEFHGTSAASAHVAGMVALMQGHRLTHGLPLLPADAVKEWFIGTAVDAEEIGDDTKTGAGLAIIPDWVLTAAPGGLLLDQPAAEIVVGDTTTLNGIGFSAGSVIKLFVATATGPVAFGPYTPTAWTTTSLTWDVDPTIALGNGFGSAQVINTDEAFVQSTIESQLLFGDSTINIPTILTVAGTPLSPLDNTIPTANVETVVSQGATVTIGGTGFNNPLVNLFTSTGNVGPIVPEPGGTAASFEIVIPPGTVTGPGSLQVINNPYTGNVISNAVSVPIGAALDITSISQLGTTVTVNGAGFSPLSVINLFAQSASGVMNFGGLNGSGDPNVPLTILSENEFTFEAPAGALTGAAYVLVLNPPFIPFASTTGDPEGGFTMTVGP